MASFEIAKAGWLQRQSTVLHRWKRSWVVLYQDGNLKYFNDQNSCVAEEATFLPTLCTRFAFGKMVNYVDPPAGFDKNCLFQVHLQFGDPWTFCADTPDDLVAWQMSLEPYFRAAANNVVTRPGQTVVYTGNTGYCPPVGTVQTTYRPGTTTTYITNGASYGGYPNVTSYNGYPGQVIAAPGQSVVVAGAPGTTYVTSGVGLANTIVLQQPTYRRNYWY